MDDQNLHALFTQLRSEMMALNQQVSCLPRIQQDIGALKVQVTETREVVEAWTTAKTLGRFAKWAIGITASAIALFSAIKAGLIK